MFFLLLLFITALAAVQTHWEVDVQSYCWNCIPLFSEQMSSFFHLFQCKDWFFKYIDFCIIYLHIFMRYLECVGRMSADNMMLSSPSASVKSTEYQWPSSDQLHNYRNPQSLNLFTSSPVIMSVVCRKGNRDGGLWTPLFKREAGRNKTVFVPSLGGHTAMCNLWI